MNGRGSDYERELLAFQLVLATTPVVGHPPRGTDEQLRRLAEVDPDAAWRVLDGRQAT